MAKFSRRLGWSTLLQKGYLSQLKNQSSVELSAAMFWFLISTEIFDQAKRRTENCRFQRPKENSNQEQHWVINNNKIYI